MTYNSLLWLSSAGACDGNGDKTIKKLYIPNSHWRGVFVEPMSINVRDLIKFLAEKNIGHRSLVLRGAATLECAEPTIKVERPLYEEKNASIPVGLVMLVSGDGLSLTHFPAWQWNSIGCDDRSDLCCLPIATTREESGQ